MDWMIKFFLTMIVWLVFICLYATCGMWLWNILMPEIFGLSTINWIQSLGLMCLFGIMIRGFNVNYSTTKDINK